MKRTLKRVLGPIIIAATIGIFIWYLRSHPESIEQISNTPPWTIAAILALYFAATIVLAAIMAVSLRFFDRRMSPQENFLLTAYSSIVNFFGPGQSGPGVRAVYLKVKHGVTIKQYAFVTLLYYGWFAVISGALVGLSGLAWYYSLLFALGIGLASYLFIHRYSKKHPKTSHTSAKGIGFVRLTFVLGLLTLAQILCIAGAYFLELRVVDQSVSILQALSYTGAANFALFVSLTPGAIGFREAFLLFSQEIHGIGQQVILAASVIDRAAYLVFLALLFLIVLAMHAQKKLQVKDVRSDQAPNAKS